MVTTHTTHDILIGYSPFPGFSLSPCYPRKSGDGLRNTKLPILYAHRQPEWLMFANPAVANSVLPFTQFDMGCFSLYLVIICTPQSSSRLRPFTYRAVIFRFCITCALSSVLGYCMFPKLYKTALIKKSLEHALPAPARHAQFAVLATAELPAPFLQLKEQVHQADKFVVFFSM